MPDDRRNRVPGGTWFFTVNPRDRSSRLRVRHIDGLRQALRAACARAPFHIDAWVVLPEHMNCIWTEGGSDVSGRWRAMQRAVGWASAHLRNDSAPRRRNAQQLPHIGKSRTLDLQNQSGATQA